MRLDDQKRGQDGRGDSILEGAWPGRSEYPGQAKRKNQQGGEGRLLPELYKTPYLGGGMKKISARLMEGKFATTPKRNASHSAKNPDRGKGKRESLPKPAQGGREKKQKKKKNGQREWSEKENSKGENPGKKGQQFQMKNKMACPSRKGPRATPREKKTPRGPSFAGPIKRAQTVGGKNS